MPLFETIPPLKSLSNSWFFWQWKRKTAIKREVSLFLFFLCLSHLLQYCLHFFPLPLGPNVWSKLEAKHITNYYRRKSLHLKQSLAMFSSKKFPSKLWQKLHNYMYNIVDSLLNESTAFLYQIHVVRIWNRECCTFIIISFSSEKNGEI